MFKNFICFIVITALLFLNFPLFSIENCGDINQDTYVDIVDALVIAQYYVGLSDCLGCDNNVPFCGDIDNNGIIDIVDALVIAQYDVGLITEIPCENVTAEKRTGWVDNNGNSSSVPTDIYLVQIESDAGQANTFFHEKDGMHSATIDMRIEGEQDPRYVTIHYLESDQIYPKLLMMNDILFILTYNEDKTMFDTAIEYKEEGVKKLEVLTDLQFTMDEIDAINYYQNVLKTSTDAEKIVETENMLKTLIIYTSFDKIVKKGIENTEINRELNRCAPVIEIIQVTLFVIAVIVVVIQLAEMYLLPIIKSNPSSQNPPPTPEPTPEGPTVREDNVDIAFPETELGYYVELSHFIGNIGGGDLLINYYGVKNETGMDVFSIVNPAEIFQVPILPGTEQEILFGFTALEPGYSSVTLEIHSNVNDENNSIIRYNLSGSATGPWFFLTHDDNNINNGMVGKDFGSKYIGSAYQSVDFVMENRGNETLNVDTTNIIMSNNTDFDIVLTNTEPSISPGENTSFQVLFRPETIGDKETILTIPSNDYRYTDSPYFSFIIQGRGTYSPETEINVLQDATYISSGETVDYEIVLLSTPVNKTFTIQNIGEADLTINSITIDNDIDFSIIPVVTPITILSGDKISIDITCNPVSIGDKQTELRIVSNDDDEGTYIINIIAKGDEIVEFPDEVFSNSIHTSLNKISGDIYRTELETLTSIKYVDRGITDITGIQYCINLETLDLSENSITDIGHLYNLTNLTGLDLNHNNIIDISSLNYLTNLVYLNLDFNSQIGSITNLFNLVNLEVLAVGETGIDNLDVVSNFPQLKELYAGGNDGITEISALSSISSLTKVFLGGCQIIDPGPLSYHDGLTDISLRYNNVQDITSIEGFTNLVSLDIVFNRMDLTPESLNRAVVNNYINNGVNVQYIDGNNL